VFEDLDQAAKYRQYVCNTLKSSSADIVTLCGNKLSGRGVVLGSGFKVVPVEQAPCRFGTIPRAQQVGMCCLRGLECLMAVIPMLTQRACFTRQQEWMWHGVTVIMCTTSWPCLYVPRLQKGSQACSTDDMIAGLCKKAIMVDSIWGAV
jgi:hypothetical protein